MSAFLDRIRREPALVTGVIQAALALAVTLGLDLPPGADAAILALAAAILAILTRAQVTPTVTVAAEQPDPDGPLVAGEASEVPDGEPVEVVPADPRVTSAGVDYEPRHDID